MVGIVDYGMGNLLSVYSALEMVGAEPMLCQHPEELRDVERIILPGVGAFRDCMETLRTQGFVDALNEAVFQHGKPIFGICLGMEAMARKSYEFGEYEGLGWFEADVIRIQPNDPSLRVPQVGWNDISYRQNSPLLARLPSAPDFYFIHSYYMKCDKEEDVDAYCDYGGPITAVVRKNNIFGTQFHPEKSQDYGLRILENFVEWRP